MHDFVKEHKVGGLSLIKESEIERLLRQNHQNSLIAEVPLEGEQETIDSFHWKERAAFLLPKHKLDGEQDFLRTMHNELVANEDKIGLP